MRRLAMLLTVGMAIGLWPALSHAADADRTVSKRYTMGRAQIHWNDTGYWVGTQREFFRAERRERSVSVSLQDDSGRPVRGRLEVGSDVIEFCSETSKPVQIRPGQYLAVNAIFGTCGAGPSVVTEGTIRVAFSPAAS